MQRHPNQKTAASRRATRQIWHGTFWLAGGFLVHQLLVPHLVFHEPIQWAMWGAMALGGYLVVMGAVAWIWTSNHR